MDFKNISDDYRAVPFWSWNERLDKKETARQISIMKNAGLGGYFMHARGGLQTPYMGDEWFENVTVGVEEGKKLGMSAWAYDENGWPSGFGNGIVTAKGLDFQQKYLRVEEGEKQTDRTICNKDGYHFYFDVNPFYCDTLNPDATDVFLKEIYEPYYNKYKNDIEGFFTDEPQISRDGIPWSFIMRGEYEKAYGEDLYERLIELFKNQGDYKNTRLKFWKMVTNLFSKNFFKKIYEWCDERGLKLTGHLVLEELLEHQVTSNGAVMPHYEYFHIPGIDWLTRGMPSNLGQIQLGSAARQLGKKRLLSESFALCGHNVSYNELKGIFEWQMVRGINLLCPHLEGYSLRGIRKRDYPPAMYYQQPWWSEYKSFIEAMARVGKIIAEGDIECDTLVIHPQSSVWAAFNTYGNEGLEEISDSFKKALRTLDEKHISYHLGDETLMERHARVEGNKLIIGLQSYSKVILPCNEILFDNTKKLLEEYAAGGGKIVSIDEIEADNIIDNPEITYTKRIFNDCCIHYFVNSTDKEQRAFISSGSKVLDILTGELCAFDGRHVFEPFGSLVVVDDGSERTLLPSFERKTLPLDGEWEIKSASDNAVTLDLCDYYFDGELQEKNGYVLNIQKRACDLERPVALRQEYHIKADIAPKRLYLVCETPEIFDISINGEEVDKTDCGYYIDSAFRKIDIHQYIKTGENTIAFNCIFKQSDTIYKNLKNALLFEGEKNKITYDIEIEPVYLVGDFSVRTDGRFEQLDKNAVRYSGDFVLGAPKTSLLLNNIEQHGYPFFCGSIRFTKNVILDDTGYKLKFEKFGVNILKAAVNGKEYKLLWGSNEIDISSSLKPGENQIELELTNNLRNILGPHHLEEGESLCVGPGSFFKEKCIWNDAPEKIWNDKYCFVEFGLTSK